MIYRQNAIELFSGVVSCVIHGTAAVYGNRAWQLEMPKCYTAVPKYLDAFVVLVLPMRCVLY